MGPVATLLGLVTIAVALVFGLIGLVVLIVHLWRLGRVDGTTWRLGVVFVIIFWLLRSCLGSHT